MRISDSLRLSSGRRISLAGLVALMSIGGLMHFVATDSYTQAVPRFLPYRRELVYLSGLAEMAAGVLLVPRATRRAGAWFTVVLLVLIFPANIQMAVDGPRQGQGFPLDSAAALWLRLPLQAVFILWAQRFTRRQRAQ